MSIALYHFHVTQIKRSAGQSAIASAAYRSGEKLHSEYYLKPTPLPPDHPRHNFWFDEDGHICVKNPSAFWLPEFTLQKEIGGTIYSVTGTYDGTETLDKKMERIMAEKFTEKLEDSE